MFLLVLGWDVLGYGWYGWFVSSGIFKVFFVERFDVVGFVFWVFGFCDFVWW